MEVTREMTITVSDFLGMALNNNFEFSIYDFSKEKNIFESWHEDMEMSEEMEDMIVESWNLNNGILELNVNSDDE